MMRYSGLCSSAPGGATSADLTRRILTGDRDAETELVARYGERLAFLLRRWTRDDATSEDLYQESFKLALEKLRCGELREPEKLAEFLRGLARNLCLHHYRLGDRREARWKEATEPLSSASPRNAMPGPPPPEHLDRLLVREKAKLVRTVLAELPRERDREILSRYYIAEQDKQRICWELELSGDHFKRVLFRARERFRELYEQRLRDRSAGLGKDER